MEIADFLLRGIDFIQDIPGRIMGKTQEVSMSAEFIPSPGMFDYFFLHF